MKLHRVLAVFLLVFIAGCVASQFIVPPVRAGATPVRWEYLQVERPAERMNEAGKEGWELAEVAVTSFGTYGYFKRPLP